MLLYEQGKVAEAEPLMREALEGRREVLGPRHPDTLSSAKWAAKLLNESGRAEDGPPALGGQRVRQPGGKAVRTG